MFLEKFFKCLSMLNFKISCISLRIPNERKKVRGFGEVGRNWGERGAGEPQSDYMVFKKNVFFLFYQGFNLFSSLCDCRLFYCLFILLCGAMILTFRPSGPFRALYDRWLHPVPGLCWNWTQRVLTTLYCWAMNAALGILSKLTISWTKQ